MSSAWSQRRCVGCQFYPCPPIEPNQASAKGSPVALPTSAHFVSASAVGFIAGNHDLGQVRAPAHPSRGHSILEVRLPVAAQAH